MLGKLKLQTSVGKRFSTQNSAFPTALALALIFMSVLGINAQTIIYDNGPLATGAVARNGTAAPAGAQFSEVSYNFGETASSNDFAGFGCARIVFPHSFEVLVCLTFSLLFFAI